MSHTITVLIVDDHDVVRQGVRAYLEGATEFKVVGEAASSEEALHLVLEYSPDVVLLDLILPDTDGINTIWQIKHISPGSQVVVLTAFHDDIHIFPALKAGAISYILKDVKMEDLAEVIRSAARCEVTLHHLVAERVLRSIRQENSAEETPFANLTDRELVVLKFLAHARTNKEIAEQLRISEVTVKGYVGHILHKLHVDNRTQAAVFAWQKGLMQQDQ